MSPLSNGVLRDNVPPRQGTRTFFEVWVRVSRRPQFYSERGHPELRGDHVHDNIVGTNCVGAHGVRALISRD